MNDAMSERLALLEERLALLERTLAAYGSQDVNPSPSSLLAVIDSFSAPFEEQLQSEVQRRNVVSISNLSELDGEEFVATAYRVVLLKEVDPDGLAYHMYELARGQDKAAILKRLANEEEAIAAGIILAD